MTTTDDDGIRSKEYLSLLKYHIGDFFHEHQDTDLVFFVHGRSAIARKTHDDY